MTGPAASEAARAWLAAVDFERLPSEQFSLLPLAVDAIKQADPAAPWLPRIRGVYRRAWYANQLFLEATARLARTLTVADIPVLLADAVPLSLSVYGDRLRPIDSLDLIIPHDRARQAGRVLAAQGWHDLAGAAPYAAGPWDIVRRFRTPGGLHANLHWHAAAFWPSYEMDAAAWKRAQPLTVNGHAVLAL
ncbi:MAG: nucleotidyltransferase family protein, partial [Anaerolineae bacterium]|nr:nucleotidyltransferase family protein [Anaerolineae bacterium]